uniref:ATP synthase subunit a n=1 Tax=Eoacmaea sp. AORI_YK\|nr:ATP synthase F0 subunit 6 [Eoacmaea sp. AORI_YK\
MSLDLFSSFDEQNMPSLWGPLVWVFPTTCVLVMMFSFWVSFSSLSFLVFVFHKMFGCLYNSFSLFLTSYFCVIVFGNIVGLVPYIFSSTSHLVFTFSLSLPMWLGVVVSGVVYSYFNVLAHITPEGAPLALAPVLVWIETISLLIRPWIVGIRLMANMVAGHIIVNLIASSMVVCIFNFFTGLVFVNFILMFYLAFEVGVCLIQGYIFCMLNYMYMLEHP